MTTAEDFIARGFETYEIDPADSDHQRGFLSAMIQMAEHLGMPVGDELKAQLTMSDEERKAKADALRESLRDMLDRRNVTLGRNPKHAKTRDAELEFLCGAGQALHAVDNPLSNVVTMWAFLHTTGRDPLR